MASSNKIGVKQISSLLAALYSAPGEPARWTQFLRTLSVATRTPHAVLFSHDFVRVDFPMHFTYSMPVESQELYASYYGNIDQWAIRGRELLKEGWVGTSRQLCPESELRKSEFYADYLRKFDFFHQAGLVAEKRDSAISVLSLLRGEHQPHFEKSAIEVLNLLLPHLAAALRLDRKLRDLKVVSSAAVKGLEYCDAALLAVDADARIVFSTEKALRVISGETALKVANGRLVTKEPKVAALLSDSIRSAARTATGAALFSGNTLTLPGGKTGPITLSIVPFHHDDPLASSPPRALIFIVEQETRLVTRTTAMRQAYNLTPTECRLADLLVAGQTVAEAANEMHITYESGRSMLKSIFHKTSTHRQAELVRLLLKLPAT